MIRVPGSGRKPVSRLPCVFLYAASDEFHQIFVPTRTAQVSDVFIDTAGGAAVCSRFGLLAAGENAGKNLP